MNPKLRRDDAHLVTEARRSRSDDIAYRERRYLIMMAFRVVCFGLAIVLFTQGAGWLAAIPAVGAIVLPYFAVVFANGGREPVRSRGFREYEPNLPVVSAGPGRARPGPADGRDTPPAHDADAAAGTDRAGDVAPAGPHRGEQGGTASGDASAASGARIPPASA